MRSLSMVERFAMARFQFLSIVSIRDLRGSNAFLDILLKFDNWTFTLEQPDSHAATSFGVPSTNSLEIFDDQKKISKPVPVGHSLFNS